MRSQAKALAPTNARISEERFSERAWLWFSGLQTRLQKSMSMTRITERGKGEQSAWIRQCVLRHARPDLESTCANALLPRTRPTCPQIAVEDLRKDVGEGDGFGVFRRVTSDLAQRPHRCRLDVVLHLLHCSFGE